MRPEPVELEFLPNGELLYSVDAGDRWRVARLIYRVDGDVLVTDQASDPREERTRFRFQPDGVLVLEFDGRQSRYRQGEKRAPRV